MEAKDSKGNVIKVGDTVKVLRKWNKGEGTLNPDCIEWGRVLHKTLRITEIDGNHVKAGGFWLETCTLEKVQATTETFKVLITGCETPVYWYESKTGDIIEVREVDSDKYYFATATSNKVSKSDCHVIEPVWKVMKDAEEQKRAVDIWSKIHCKWRRKDVDEWYDDSIYRLAPKTKQPEYVEYGYEDREKLRGLWVRRKSDGAELMIGGIEKETVAATHFRISYKKLFDEYETLDGQPVGKLK